MNSTRAHEGGWMSWLNTSALFAAMALLTLIGGYQAWHAFVPASTPSWDEQTLRNDIAQVPRRTEPLEIRPTRAFRDLVTDDELGVLVASVDPCWPGPNVGLMLHSLRVWGSHARFEHTWQLPQVGPLVTYDAPIQLAVLLDHSVFENAFRRNYAIPTFLAEGKVGVSVLTNKDPDIGSEQGQFHVDHLLQVLGEIGVPANEPVFPRPSSVDRRHFTVNDLINESLWTYSSLQEPEFTATAYSRWLKPPAVWRNRFGEETHLDDLVDQLLERPIGQGACLGIHVNYALVSILRANEIEPIIGDDAVQAIRAHLREVSDILAQRQHRSGAWSLDWHGPFEKTDVNWLWYLDVPPYPELMATGHHLEWIALAPPELCPPRDVVKRAVEFLKRAVRDLPEPLFAEVDVYPLGTHAVRSLCLLRDVQPAEIRRRFPVPPRGTSPLERQNAALQRSH